MRRSPLPSFCTRAPLLALAVALLGCITPAQVAGEPKPGPAPATFANGLPDAPDFFPVGVWLQSPHNAKAYAELGVNLYVGLFDGPTKAQLDALEDAGMRVVCAQNDVALAHRGRTIVGWLHGDEPDNAQAMPGGHYGPPVPPRDVVAKYHQLRERDPTRPVLLNLGQGAAWDGWHGRGVRTNRPEDYPEYVQGCDVVSFDIYPVTHQHRDVQGRLEFVGEGVRRLLAAGKGAKPVWACIETGHVDNAKVRPTAAQVRSEVWIAVASGASGVVFFVHEFQPRFVEASLLGYPEIAAEVKALAAELRAAAPILRTPRRDELVVSDAGERLAVRVHEHDGALHVFTASLQPEPLRATLTVRGAGKAKGPVEVVGGGEPRPLTDGRFRDDFAGYAVRHFRLAR